MSSLYNLVSVLHILAGIVGFGGLIAHSMYHSRAMRASAVEAETIFGSTLGVTSGAHYAIYAVGILGIILVSLSDGGISFSELWISLSFLVWFAMIGVAHALIRPNLKRAQARAAELDASAAFADDEAGVSILKKVALGDLLFQVLLVAALVLMVWKPGAGPAL